jgi:hypothetical protein
VFFLDFTRDRERGPDLEGESIFGQGVVGSQIVNGVDIGPGGRSEETGFYNLANGYSSARGASGPGVDVGGVGNSAFVRVDRLPVSDQTDIDALTEEQKALIEFDPDILDPNKPAGSDLHVLVCDVAVADLSLCDPTLASAEPNESAPAIAAGTNGKRGLDLGGTAQNNVELLPKRSLMSLAFDNGVGDNAIRVVHSGLTAAQLDSIRVVRRLTRLTSTNTFDLVQSGDTLRVVIMGEVGAIDALTDGGTIGNGSALLTADMCDLTFAIVDPTVAANLGRGAIDHLAPGELESSLVNPFSTDGMSIPEIDISVDSVSLTAETKKMKAKWTQELQQDLNAYHNLDAEVELTSVLSEQIALELDQEILHDLITGATAGTRYWSRNPGNFVDRASGVVRDSYRNRQRCFCTDSP